jgi:2-polyprenyl-6-methoxyphenol hydroxylase-like FAD-dependent oxidoreductase
MKILIVGGGVAGLALASFLQDHDEVTVVEKAHQWGDVGYAIALWGNGQKILRELGAEHDVVKEGYEIPWGAIFDKHGDLLNKFPLEVLRKYGAGIIVTRTTLHHALIKTLTDSVRVFFGTTLTKLTQESHGATVTLSNGTTEFFDLVVGADGIHSQVRDMVFGQGFFQPFGWNVWAFWTPRTAESPIGALDLISGGKMYVVYPMEDRAVVMLTATGKAAETVEPQNRQAKLKHLFADFKESVDHMIDAIEEPDRIFQDHLAHVVMPRWYLGRVALMGDAQHASSPLTGMGTSMALEDAYVLAQELKRLSNSKEIPQALANYERRRSHRINEFRRMSSLLETFMMIKSPILAFLRNLLFRLLPSSFFVRPVEKILQYEL